MTGRPGYFARRWQGEVALPALFWRDMLGVGTALNLLASFAALMAAAMGLDARLAVALHFAPVPVNVFVALAVWRSPQRRALTGCGFRRSTSLCLLPCWGLAAASGFASA